MTPSIAVVAVFDIVVRRRRAHKIYYHHQASKQEQSTTQARPPACIVRRRNNAHKNDKARHSCHHPWGCVTTRQQYVAALSFSRLGLVAPQQCRVDVRPQELSESILEKARAEQELERMELGFLKASQEAKRKSIEAEGIADLQWIVSEGITPSLLQWKGIEATEKFADSPNSKIIIMENSKESLPIILGSESLS